MLLDISLGKETLSINIENPFRLDMDSLMVKINEFALSQKISLHDIDIPGLVPKMVKGIAGCEKGCPSNAKGLVEQGFKNFSLNYIEGGILSAEVTTEDKKVLTIKMFPDF